MGDNPSNDDSDEEIEEGFFGSTEFSDKDGEIDSVEHFELAHNPEILYYNIQDKHKKLKKGLSIDTDGDDIDVLIYSKVDIFESTMKYIEEFIIYFLSYLKGREKLIEYLIRTQPKEVKQFFEHARVGEEEKYLSEHGIDEDYEAALSRMFGYAYIDEVTPIEEEDYSEFDMGPKLSPAELDEMKKRSVEQLTKRIQLMGEFYLRYDAAYNAAKHGKRVIPAPYTELEIPVPNEENVTIPSEGVVQFLCKHEDSAFTLVYPVDHLLEQSLSQANSVHTVFKYLKRIVNASRNEKKPRVTFFDSRDEGSSTREYVKIINEDTSIYIEKTKEIEWLIPEDVTSTLAIKLQVNGRTVVFNTKGDEKTSTDYPISITFKLSESTGIEPRQMIDCEFNFTLLDLDVDQYINLQRLQGVVDTDGVKEYKLCDDTEGTISPIGTSNSHSVLSIDDSIGEYVNVADERLETLHRLQLATSQRIPVPSYLNEEQREIVDEARESDFTRELTQEYVDKLRATGSDEKHTLFRVEKITEEGEVIEAQDVGSIPNQYNFNFNSDNSENEELLSKSNEPGFAFRAPVHGYDTDYDELIEDLEDDLSVVEDILDCIAIEDSPTNLFVWHKKGHPRFWFTNYTLRIQVLESQSCEGAETQ